MKHHLPFESRPQFEAGKFGGTSFVQHIFPGSSNMISTPRVMMVVFEKELFPCHSGYSHNNQKHLEPNFYFNFKLSVFFVDISKASSK